MEATQDLFEQLKTPLIKQTPRKIVSRWQFVTNHKNLFFMLASGLFMPPEGFGKKYYRDTLAQFPGWLPLFPEVVPPTAIACVVSEEQHLIPCLLTLNLATLTGPVKVLGANGKFRDADFPQGLDGSEQLLLIPPPLPTCWIDSILLSHKEALLALESDAADYANVPLGDFKCKVSAKDFSGKSALNWPPEGDEAGEFPENRAKLALPFAAGGIMALLSHLASLDEGALHACQAAFATSAADAPAAREPLLAPLAHWMARGEVPENVDVSARLFWEIVHQLTSNRFSAMPLAAQDVVLEELTLATGQLEEKMSLALSKLGSDLKKIASGFSDSTVSELLERHPKPFSRALLLFFLRDNCTDFLAFQHPLLNTADRLAAAILFAVRESWLGLPLHLRDIPGLSPAVTQRMAEMAQRIGGTRLTLGIPLPRPMLLVELFRPGERGWSNVQKNAALVLARESKWPCIQTRISLGKGDYRLEVASSGLQILLSGEVKAVLSEVDQQQFLLNLEKTPIPEKLECKIRDLFKS